MFKKRYFRLKKYCDGYRKGNIISNSEKDPICYNNHYYAQFRRRNFMSFHEGYILKNPDIFEEIFYDENVKLIKNK